MHFYLIRSDLTGFQHVHPNMSVDGTWTAPLAAAQPGTYRVYASFNTKDASSGAQSAPHGARSRDRHATTGSVVTTRVDGYTLALTGDQLMARRAHTLTVTVSKDSQPVTDLQPYHQITRRAGVRHLLS